MIALKAQLCELYNGLIPRALLYLRDVSVPWQGNLSPWATSGTRPQPTYPKGQLITKAPLRLLNNGLVTSHRILWTSLNRPYFWTGLDLVYRMTER